MKVRDLRLALLFGKTAYNTRNKLSTAPLEQTNAKIKAKFIPACERSSGVAATNGKHIVHRGSRQLSSNLMDRMPKDSKSGPLE